MGTTRPGEARVTCRQEDDLRTVGGLGAGPVHSAASCALAAQKSNCASASRVSPRSVALAATSADSSSRMRPTSSSTAACASRQALPSSTMTSGSTNSVWPLPDASWTMPLTRPRASARTGHDVAAVAERDDRLLERAAELRPDERVEPAPEPVVRHADRASEPTESGRRRVEQLAHGVEAPGERAPQRGQRVESPADVAEQRPAIVGEGRGQPRRGVERVADAQELLGLETTTTDGPPHGGLDVVGRTDADAGTLREQRPCLVGLVEPAGHDHRVGRRQEGLREAA